MSTTCHLSSSPAKLSCRDSSEAVRREGIEVVGVVAVRAGFDSCSRASVRALRAASQSVHVLLTKSVNCRGVLAAITSFLPLDQFRSRHRQSSTDTYTIKKNRRVELHAVPLLVEWSRTLRHVKWASRNRCRQALSIHHDKSTTCTAVPSSYRPCQIP